MYERKRLHHETEKAATRQMRMESIPGSIWIGETGVRGIPVQAGVPFL